MPRGGGEGARLTQEGWGRAGRGRRWVQGQETIPEKEQLQVTRHSFYSKIQTKAGPTANAFSNAQGLLDTAAKPAAVWQARLRRWALHPVPGGSDGPSCPRPRSVLGPLLARSPTLSLHHPRHSQATIQASVSYNLCLVLRKSPPASPGPACLLSPSALSSSQTPVS